MWMLISWLILQVVKMKLLLINFRKKGYKAGFLAHPYSTSGTKDIMKLSRIAVDRSTSFSLFKGRLGPGFVIYLQFIKILRKIPMW